MPTDISGLARVSQQLAFRRKLPPASLQIACRKLILIWSLLDRRDFIIVPCLLLNVTKLTGPFQTRRMKNNGIGARVDRPISIPIAFAQLGNMYLP